ncbi:MAG: photosynthetic complex assembly protein PuhC [Novosphingobium meiothermophilum]|uniref:photosynthetic complex assembly protein PuhC n=1 Tax=Novosphingobium TaxID=165696 RepID=UPI000D6DD5F0|nr:MULTISPECIES: photosynthetic complex assembly protein PuhC [Novosphingobium]
MSLVHKHDETVPRPALMLAGALVATTLVLTALVQTGVLNREAVPSAERASAGIAAVEIRHLTFSDRSDGAVVVEDADSGQTLAVLMGENDGGGFVRGVMRGMARERKMRGVGQEAPFELALWQNGSLSLLDPATGRSVELGSFGPDNRAAFMQFLKTPAKGAGA